MSTTTSISVPALRELATPRPARFTQATRTGRLVMFNSWVGLLIYLLLLMNRHVNHYQLLATNGNTTTASITKMSVHSGKTTTYSVEYEFSRDGRTYRDDLNVNRSTYQTTSLGDPLTVTYLPSNPTQFEAGKIDSSDVRETQAVWIFWIFITSGALALIFACVVSEQNKHLRFLRDGTLVDATVTKREMVEAKTTSYYLTVTFTAGATNITHRAAVTQEFYDATEQGQTIPVLYLPSDPSQVIPVTNLDGVLL